MVWTGDVTFGGKLVRQKISTRFLHLGFYSPRHKKKNVGVKFYNCPIDKG